MTETSWAGVRAVGVDKFDGHLPRGQDEAIIIEIFEGMPSAVIRAIDEVAASFQQGKVTYPWSALRARLERGSKALRETTADVGVDKAKAITRAEQWIRATGKHFDRASEVLDVLFVAPGERSGPVLGAWADDEALRERMLTLWREVRPEGELIAEQAEERAARWMAAKLAKPQAEEPEPALAEPEPSLA